MNPALPNTPKTAKPVAGRLWRIIITVALPAFALFAVAGYLYLPIYRRTPHFNGSSPVLLEVVARSPQPDAVVLLQTSITNQTACTSVLEFLGTARRGEDHKCMEIGSLTVRYNNGKTDRIRFLPGHDPERYEIRYGDWKYELPRKKFYQVLKDAGIDSTKMPVLEH